MLKRGIDKFFNNILDRPLPRPSEREQVFLAELQVAFQEFLIEKDVSSPSEKEWAKNMDRLRELVLSKDPREFLRWDVVSSTMFADNAPYIRTELRYLQRCSDWDLRWSVAIKESWVGHPSAYIFYPSSSSNLIHHAYHLAQFEKKTKTSISHMDFILEFGGGYGSMCRLFHNLGFCGKYVIFDLPPFSALQRYYLQTLGLPVLTPANAVKAKTGIVCISDFQQLKTIMHLDEKNAMFIATWSISETPVKIREMFMPFMGRFNSFLMAYQDKFGEVDNISFFDCWQKINDHVVWQNWQIEHIPGNNYLIA